LLNLASNTLQSPLLKYPLLEELAWAISIITLVKEAELPLEITITGLLLETFALNTVGSKPV